MPYTYILHKGVCKGIEPLRALAFSLIFLPFILFVNKNELINWFSIIGIENTSNINFFNRLFIYLILIQLISVFLPSKIDNKYTLRIKSSGIKLLITISLSFLYKIIYL